MGCNWEDCKHIVDSILNQTKTPIKAKGSLKIINNNASELH